MIDDETSSCKCEEIIHNFAPFTLIIIFLFTHLQWHRCTVVHFSVVGHLRDVTSYLRAFCLWVVILWENQKIWIAGGFLMVSCYRPIMLYKGWYACIYMHSTYQWRPNTCKESYTLEIKKVMNCLVARWTSQIFFQIWLRVVDFW